MFPLTDLANTNIQYKQTNYDADNIDNNKLKEQISYIVIGI